MSENPWASGAAHPDAGTTGVPAGLPPRPRTPEEVAMGPSAQQGDAEALPGLVLHATPGERPAATDRVSVAALVFGVVGLAPVAIVLGIVGLVRTKRPGVSGRRLAISGIALGVLWSVAFLAVFVFAVVLGHRVVSSVQDLKAPAADSGVAPDDPSAITKAASEVEVGECLLGWDPAAVSAADADAELDVVAVDCATPHQAQAFQQVDLSQTFPAAAAWPGVAVVTSRGATACQGQVADSVDPALGGGLSVAVIVPALQAWASGSRAVTCLVVAPAASLTASVTQ